MAPRQDREREAHQRDAGRADWQVMVEEPYQKADDHGRSPFANVRPVRWSPGTGVCKAVLANSETTFGMGGESVPGQDKPFNALFQEHLERGTRADQRADDPSRRKWKHADFASQIAVDQRSVTNWKNGSRTPLKPEFDKIVAQLFGDNPLHTAAKAAFIAAWQTADSQRGGAREALPKTLIPPRQAGPYFGIGPDMRLRQEQAPELDAAGNNLRRIAEQLPLVREAMEDLAERIGPNNNAFPELVRILARYRSAIAGNEPISWGLVWGLGVRLEEAAAAAERQIDRMAPTLEDAAHAALQAWRTLHAPLILATAEGREQQSRLTSCA